MGHVPVSGKFERVAMDLLDVSVISGKGHKYILVVCDYFAKYTEAYPLTDSVVDALMDKWLPTFGFPLFLHSDQGKEFDNEMVHKLSELLGTVKTKTTPYQPRSDGLVERFNRTLLAMLAMFVSREHDNWDDLLPFMMLAYNITVHTCTGFTPHRLVFGEELRPDPPPRDIGDYASWIRQALYEAYDEVRAQQQRATHRQKRNYDSKAVARTFPIRCWVLRYYPPACKNKLCSPWIGPYKVVRAPMEWVVGIQVDADARIFYVHMDDLKRCAPPDPTPSWPDVARGTSIVLSTRAPSTTAPTIPDPSPTGSDSPPMAMSDQSTRSDDCGDGDARAPPMTVHTENSPADTSAPSKTIWDLQDENCILSKNSKCRIDFKGFRFHSMETLLCTLELEMLGDTKHIRQLAKYTRMEYVRRCAKTLFELASNTLQDKWLCEQFTAWSQIISARIFLDTKFKQALMDSCDSPLCDPNDTVYYNALMSSRKMCTKSNAPKLPTWIESHTQLTRGQVER